MVDTLIVCILSVLVFFNMYFYEINIIINIVDLVK